MINVKDQVYAALSEVADNVTDLYPQDWSTFPAIQYTEEANNVVTRTDNIERIAYLRYRVDIWDAGSTSETAIKVDEALAALGLIRTQCEDVALEPIPGAPVLRHKQMRFEAQIDVATELTYWEANA